MTYLKINVYLAKQVSPIELYLLQLKTLLNRDKLTLLKLSSIYDVECVMNRLLKYPKNSPCLPSEVFLRKVY